MRLSLTSALPTAFYRVVTNNCAAYLATGRFGEPEEVAECFARGIGEAGARECRTAWQQLTHAMLATNHHDL